MPVPRGTWQDIVSQTLVWKFSPNDAVQLECTHYTTCLIPTNHAK